MPQLPERLTTSVLHLVGSAVDEFHADLSRLYAGACLAALTDSARDDVHLAYVSPDGWWVSRRSERPLAGFGGTDVDFGRGQAPRVSRY